MNVRFLLSLPVATAILAAIGAGPTTALKDETLDWLIDQSRNLPATRATTAPATEPFGERNDRGARHGVLTTNDNEKHRGMLATTAEKPLRIYDDATKEFRDIPYAVVKSIDAVIVWEREEREWHFKESGSDIKEYSGKTYPARELKYTITLVNGQSVTGAVAAPIYLIGRDGDYTFVLYKRQKGEIGQTLKDLPYVKSVELD